VTATANSLKAPTRSTVRAARDQGSLVQSGARRPMTSLRASLASLGPVLTSSGTGRTRRPFHSHPHRLFDQPRRVGMKGAGRSGTADEASTAGVSATSDEERSEAPDRSGRGLSGCLRWRFQVFLRGLSGCLRWRFQVFLRGLSGCLRWRFQSLLLLSRRWPLSRTATVAIHSVGSSTPAGTLGDWMPSASKAARTRSLTSVLNVTSLRRSVT